MAVNSPGDLQVAIRRMVRWRHPRERRVLWIVLGVAAALVGVVQVVRGDASPVVPIAAAAVLGVIAMFGLVGRLLGWTLLAIGLGLGLGMLPLFGVLGLELALVTALFAAIMAADVGSALARELARIPPSGVKRAAYPGRTIARGALAAAGLTCGITTVVAVIAALRGIVVPTCDWRFGILSFVAMPLATAALFGALGHAIGALAGPRRFLGAALVQLPALVVAGAALYRFYATPPVYTYNAILGYFPGNMYDENVQLTTALAWSRLQQVAWVIAALAVVAWRFDVASYRVRLRAPRPAGRRLGALGIAVVAAAAAVGLHWQGGKLGFAVDAEEIEDALDGRLETEHFVIHYSQSPEIRADLAIIAADHEYRFAQVTEQLGVVPREKIVSFYFADRDHKARLHGSRDVEMAKPWRHEIYVDHRPFPHGSLRHEIAHVVAAEFGDWMWNVSAKEVLGVPVLFNPGLIEGLATAVDWPVSYDRPNPHESVRILQKLGTEPTINSLLGLTFFTTSSAKGYTTAGSFLRFLLDRYGAARLRDVYENGGDFEAAYGMPRDRLVAEWREMLAKIEVPDSAVKASEERFRGGSVFAKPCVHAIAKRREHAGEAWAAGDREEAIELMRSVCSDSPGEPAYRLVLGDFLYSLDGADRSEAHVIWMQVATDWLGVTATLRVRAFERLTRSAVRAGDLPRARELVAFARTLPLSVDDRRQIEGMAFALNHEGPAAAPLRAYFFAASNAQADAQAAVVAEPELGLAHYLLALQLYNHDDHAAATKEFELALARELPSHPFVRNAARLLAVAAYRTHDMSRLAIATAVLSSSAMTSGDHLLAKDWQDRIRFDALRGKR